MKFVQSCSQTMHTEVYNLLELYNSVTLSLAAAEFVSSTMRSKIFVYFSFLLIHINLLSLKMCPFQKLPRPINRDSRFLAPLAKS